MGLITTSGSRLVHDFPDAPALQIGNSALGLQFINGGQGTCPTAAFDTVDGFLFAAVGRGAIGDFATASITDNNSNTLAMHGTSHAYTGTWPNSGTACYFKANATGRTGCVVSDSKPDNSDEVTLLAVNFIGVTTIEDSSFVYNTGGSTATNTTAAVTVTKPSIVWTVWAGDNENGEQGPAVSEGWTRLLFTNSTAGNHVQMCLAAKYVEELGDVTMGFTPQTQQHAQLYAFVGN